MKHQREVNAAGRSGVASAAALLLMIGACAPAAMIGPEPNEPGTGPQEKALPSIAPLPSSSPRG
jgi:hypothetical protein